MSFSISCIYLWVFQGSVFHESVLWPIHGSCTQINRLQPALKKMKYDILENIRICGPWQEEVNVTLNLFQLEGDTAYSDIQLPCNWNKFNEIKLAVWVMANVEMDLVGGSYVYLWLCESLPNSSSKCNSSHFCEFLSRKAQENMDPRTDGS